MATARAAAATARALLDKARLASRRGDASAAAEALAKASIVASSGYLPEDAADPADPVDPVDTADLADPGLGPAASGGGSVVELRRVRTACALACTAARLESAGRVLAPRCCTQVSLCGCSSNCRMRLCITVTVEWMQPLLTCPHISHLQARLELAKLLGLDPADQQVGGLPTLPRWHIHSTEPSFSHSPLDSSYLQALAYLRAHRPA